MTDQPKQTGAFNSASLTVEPRNIWPDGWFVSNGRMVKGPYAAADVFGVSCQVKLSKILAVSPERLLISRKGFKKWYAHEDLSKLYLEGGMSVAGSELGVNSDSVEASIKSELLGELEEMENLLKAVKGENGPKLSDPLSGEQSGKIVMKKTLGPSALGPTQVATPAHIEKDRFETLMGAHNKNTDASDKAFDAVSAVAKAVASSTEDLQDKKIIRDGLKHSISAADTSDISQEANVRRDDAALASEELRKFTPSKENAFAYHHMVLRGKLRLGDIKTASSELIAGFLSLGLNSGFFISRAFGESMWHMNPAANHKTSKLVVMLSMIPIINLIFYKRLAEKIQQMELQNNYHATSVPAATLLGLCPPIANAYLQAKLNKHWKLHALNVMQKK